jgi:hypothetical protein
MAFVLASELGPDNTRFLIQNQRQKQFTKKSTKMKRFTNSKREPVERIRKSFPGFIFNKVLTVFTLFLFFTLQDNAQTISSSLFGENAWYYDVSQSPPTNLDSYWDDVAASGVKYVRIGGIGENFTPLYSWNSSTFAVGSSDVSKLTHMIDQIRANGMEPIIEVGYDPTCTGKPLSGISLANQATIAANVVDEINNNLYSSNRIVYWIIANEPDLGSNCANGGGGFGYSSSSSVAAYVKQFSSSMKAKDASIKIVAPETAWYDTNIINGLTTANGTDDVTGTIPGHSYFYVDVLSFHLYGWGYPNDTWARTDVISKLTATNGFQDDLAALKIRLHNCDSVHSRSGSTSLKMAVTEANIDYANPTGDGASGVGANSFLGGQFWAEAMGICMKEGVQFLNFWSVKEGTDIHSDIGYLDRSTANPKPTYYHFQLVATNFSGTYCSGTTTHANTKVFGCITSSTISVMMLNEDASANYNYTLDLNTSGSGSIKINASNSGQHSGTLNHTSSVLLVFDLSGNLLKECDYAESDSSPNCTTYNPCTAPTASSNSPVCQSGTLNLFASTIAGATYSWTGPNSFTSSLQNPTITGAGVVNAGTYSVTATVGTCTSSPGTTTVTVPDFASIGTGGPTTFCSGGSVALYASTGTGYSWQWRKNTVDIVGATANNYTATTSGNYDVRIYNGTCYAWSAPTTVTVNSTPSAPTASSNSPVCQGSTINLTASTISGAGYSWTGPNSFTSSSQNPSISGAGVVNGGTYSVTATVGGCTSSAGTTTVTVPNFASIGVGGSTTFCSGGSVALYASTGSGYSWQWRKNTVDIVGATANNYTATAAGNYDVRIYNGTCYAWSAPTTVTVNSGLVATVTPAGATTVCSPSTVLLYGNTCSGYTYQWQKKDGSGVYQPISGATSANYTATVSGWYQVEVSSGSSHSWSSGVEVTINSCRLADTPNNADLSAGSMLTVFPNPNKGEFTVAVNSLDENDKIISIEILNSVGQLIYSSEQNVSGSSVEVPVELNENYPDGIYMVRVSAGNKTMYSLLSIAR